MDKDGKRWEDGSRARRPGERRWIGTGWTTEPDPRDVELEEREPNIDRAIDERREREGRPPIRRRSTGPCPCECSRGGFCGGCGHAGCGGR